MNFLRNIYHNFLETEHWFLTQDALPQENRKCLVKTEQDWQIEAIYKDEEWLVYQPPKPKQVIEDHVIKWKYI